MAIFTRPINNPFNKPAKSNLELVQEWKNRGLIISDDNRVIHYLDFIGYYRFSAYTIPFQNTSSISSHQFKPNTTFDDILDCYTFDRDIAYERRIYSILIALQTILYTVSPSSLWAKRLKELLEKYPNIPKKPMGIPENWYCDEFWQAALT